MSAVNNEMKKKPSLARKALISIFIISMLFLGFELTMQYLLSRAVDLDKVLSEISAALDRPVSAKSIEVSALYGLVLHDVALIDTSLQSDSSRVMIRAERVRLRPSWRKLIFGEFSVTGIRIIDAELMVQRRNGSWNMLRFWNGLNAGGDTGAARPALAIQNMRIWIADQGERWNGWNIGVKRFFLSSAGTTVEMDVREINAQECELSGTIELDKRTAVFSVNDVPSEVAKLISPNLDWRGIKATASGDWAWGLDTTALMPEAIRMSAELKAEMLALPVPSSGVCRFEPIRVKRIDISRSRTIGWSIALDDLVAGRGAGMLRISGEARGKADRLEHCKIEWDGSTEKAIALAPPGVTKELMRFNPSGASAGAILLKASGSSTPDLAQFELVARGMSMTLPEKSGLDFLEPGTVFSGITGRASLAEGRIMLSELALNLDEEQFKVNGVFESRDTYSMEITSPGMNLARFKGIGPSGIDLGGLFGAYLKISPSRKEGYLEFLGNTIEAERFGSWRINSGKIHFANDAPIRLDALAAHAGNGTVLVSGALPLDNRSRMKLELTLKDAALAQLIALADIRDTSFSLIDGAADGIIELGGTMSAPSYRGNLVLKACRIGYAGLDVSSIEGPLSFDTASISTPGIKSRIGEGAFTVSGSHSPHGIDAVITAANADGKILASFARDMLDGYEISGPIDASLKLSGRMQDIAAEGTVKFRNAEVTGPDGQSFTAVTGQVRIASDRIIADDLAGTYLEGRAHLKGLIPLSDNLDWSLTIRMDAARLEHLTRFAPEGFEGAGIVREIAASIGGKRSNPYVGGSGRLENALVRIPFLDTTLVDVTGSVTFGPDSMAARPLSFKVGSSALSISGGIEKFSSPVFHGFSIRTSEANIQDLLGLLPAKDRPLPDGIDVRGVISTEGLSINGPLDRAKYLGKITLTYGVGELSGLRRAAVGMSGDIVFQGDTLHAPSLAARIGSSEARIEGTLELKPPYKLDLRLAILDADIGELFSSIPSSGAIDKLGVSGKGTISAAISYRAGKLDLTGLLERGEVSGFKMPFSNVRGRFKYESARELLTLSEMSGTWAEGVTSDGFLEVKLSDDEPEFRTGGSIKNANLARIMRMLDLGNQPYTGLVSGKVEQLKGRFGDNETLTGSGEFFIGNARIPLIENVTARLFTDLLGKELVIEEGGGRFTIEKGVIYSREPYSAEPQSLIFKLRNRNVRLEARGYAGFDGAIAFNTRFWRNNEESRGASVRGTFSRPIVENMMQGIIGNFSR